MTATIINSLGRPAVSMGIAGVTLLVQIVLAAQLIPVQGIAGGAAASAAAYFAGLLGAAGYLTVRVGSVLPWSSIVRTAVAAALVTVTARVIGPALPVAVAAVVLGLLYLAALATLREWTMADLRQVIGRQAAKPA
jgi:O-antigen/teichoic acid export membrane protein